ncbi:hypothetical protein BD626DRAFT_477860 [Schizophyllum amplum]|uniref:Uncharacterized protein n=1 Tax=Schizophyllum amplum TaxID=97359 RepID=A0A550D0K0_9AGAR|nr:hypothetical protein BD626DRAFT_477860 [Auriculariopsis ampla]
MKGTNTVVFGYLRLPTRHQTASPATQHDCPPPPECARAFARPRAEETSPGLVATE